MAKTAVKEVSPYESVAGLVLASMQETQATHSPATSFRFIDRDTEFTVTLKKIDGQRVLSAAESKLMERVQKGHHDLTANEVCIAKRILGKQR